MNCNELAKVLVESIRNDFRNGSMTIAKNAVVGLFSFVTNCGQIQKDKIFSLISELKRAKPTMVALRNTLKLIEKSILNYGINKIHSILEDVLEQIENSTKIVVENAVQYIRNNFDRKSLSIATTSYSSTCLKFFSELGKQKSIEILILASRWKEYDYSKALFEKCQELGLKANILELNELSKMFSTIDFAITGADCVCPAKGIVNGIPTESLAQMCFRVGIPFFVVAESLKFSSFCTLDEGFEFIPFQLIQRVFSDSENFEI